MYLSQGMLWNARPQILPKKVDPPAFISLLAASSDLPRRIFNLTLEGNGM
jgi:hypothetical protein